MYTSLFVLALTGFAAPADSEMLTDYAQAISEGKAARKPLAVFIGSGEAGWNKVCKDGKIGDEVKALCNDYVCVYVDAGTETGKKLAAAFDAPEGVGLVISNRAGDRQAFAHAGTLSGGDLKGCLKKYSDANYVAQGTESVNGPIQQQSYYQPNQQQQGPTQQQQYYGPMQQSFYGPTQQGPVMGGGYGGCGSGGCGYSSYGYGGCGGGGCGYGGCGSGGCGGGGCGHGRHGHGGHGHGGRCR
jgi:hypothetical protein